MESVYCFIQLLSDNEFEKQELDLFASEGWNKEAEDQLIDRIQKLFVHIRSRAKTLKLIIQVQVADTSEVTCLLHNKLSKNGSNVKVNKLTDRELQIIDLIAQGFTNKEIAQKLYISLETVKSHRKHLLLKTGSKNTAVLIRYYQQLLVPDSSIAHSVSEKSPFGVIVK
jgi:DNA-binding CsgD family transcriptional regulator